MRKLVSYWFIIFLFLVKTGNAQNAFITGESTDGKNIRLIWYLKSWPKDMTGFTVYKKIGNKDWEPLHSKTIIPEIQRNKDYSINGLTPAASILLNEKLNGLIDQKKTREIPFEVYSKRLMSDTNALKGLALTISLDYDLALINGFACIDPNGSSGNTSYGLFYVKGNKKVDKPLAVFNTENAAQLKNVDSYTWKVQTTPDKNRLQLFFTPDSKSMQQVLLAGFNVYKQKNGIWEKLNKGPVQTKIGNAFTFFDENASRIGETIYGVAYVTNFGNQSEISTYTFDPSLIPDTYFEPSLSDPKLAVNGKTIFLEWLFNEEHKKLIRGFVLEKSILPKPFQAVTSVLSIDSRRVEDTTYSEAGTYISYRVKVIYNDETKVNGNEVLFYYLPTINTAAITKLQGKWQSIGGKAGIDLSWIALDNQIAGYQIFASNEFDQKMYLEGSIPLIKTNNYHYPVKNVKGTNFRFVIAALTKFNTVGSYSDTITVWAPGKQMVLPVLKRSQTIENKVKLEWSYQEQDLKGFRIYQNGLLVAGEYQLGKDKNSFLAGPLKPNTLYKFTLQAVSTTGIESEQSIPTEVIIYNRSTQH